MDRNKNKTFKNEIKLNIKESDLSLYIYKIEGANNNDIFHIKSFINNYYQSMDYSIYGLYICFWENILTHNMIINNKTIFLKLINIKNIKNYDYVKKILLQQLIMNTIKNKQNNNNWKYLRENIFMNMKCNFIKVQEENLEVYKKLKITCKINDNGIYLYFNHCYFIVSLENISQMKNLIKGTKIVNIISYNKLIYEETTTYKNNDIHPELKISFKKKITKDNKILENIVDNDNNIKQILVDINDNDNLILASYINSRYISKYYFIKQFIRLDKNNCRLKKDFKIKYELNEAINDIFYILKKTKYFGETYIDTDNKNEKNIFSKTTFIIYIFIFYTLYLLILMFRGIIFKK